MDDAQARYALAAAAVLGLPIRPQDEAEMLAAFMVLCDHAALVASFALPDDVEAAPRFIP